MRKPFIDKDGNEYPIDNDFHLRIWQYSEFNNIHIIDDEAIEFAFSLRDELINELAFDDSETDKIRCKHIKWFDEKHFIDMIDIRVEYSMTLPKRLENFKSFNYKSKVNNKTSNKETNSPTPTKNKSNTHKVKKPTRHRDTSLIKWGRWMTEFDNLTKKSSIPYEERFKRIGKMYDIAPKTVENIIEDSKLIAKVKKFHKDNSLL